MELLEKEFKKNGKIELLKMLQMSNCWGGFQLL